MKMKRKKASNHQPAFLFDLDGTLIDSVYPHALAWQEALEDIGIHLPAATIHRRIGMSGATLIHAFQRESGKKLSSRDAKRSEEFHTNAFREYSHQVRPLDGARELLEELTRLRVPWAIATSGQKDDAAQALKLLKLGRNVVIVTKDDVEKTKPEPDLFLVAAAKLRMELEKCVVVGDSVWDLLAAQRARALGVGLLSGGIGEDELERAGAYRVYRNAADLLAHLDDFGILSE
jgi:HAD superfamily hydrolase (TIGR01509 family)